MIQENNMKIIRNEHNSIIEIQGSGKNGEPTKEEEEIIPQMDEYRDKYVASRNKVVAFAMAGKPQAGLEIYRTETKREFNNYIDKLNSLVAFNTKAAEELNM